MSEPTKEPVPPFFNPKGTPMTEIVRTYIKLCKDLDDPDEIWIDGYDEFLEYRSDIELRKPELTDAQKTEVRWGDAVVFRRGLRYLDAFAEELLEDDHRTRYYPVSHWWWYLDRIFDKKLPKPDLTAPL
ncbi:MAG: hypothetical protein IAF08_06595 [Rhizobacter sp.]|nr:hypothetical protein [Chlorobiales bacterium]